MNCKKKVAFLDRDGTINVDKRYLHRIDDFEFLPGSIQALKLLEDLGFILVIITNQSGIARGYYSEFDFNTLDTWMRGHLRYNYDIHIFKTYYCPHLVNAELEKYRVVCNCRKPKLGLYQKAICELQLKYSLDFKNSIAVGDRMRDLTIANEIGCKGYLIGESEGEKGIEAVKGNQYKNITYKPDLLEVSKLLMANN